jgi:hypothetical protein
MAKEQANVGPQPLQPAAVQVQPPAQANQPNPAAATTPPRPAEPQQQIVTLRGDKGPIYDNNGRLTHAGAKHVINSGGSVLIDGKHYSSIDSLPSEVSMADTPEAKSAARAKLEQDQQRIRHQLDALDAKK